MTTSSKPFPISFTKPSSQQRTVQLTLNPDVRPRAHGLYVTELSRYFLFSQLRSKRSDRRLTIGVAYNASIQLPPATAEAAHAFLEWRKGEMHLVDNTPEHLTFIDGWQLAKSALIRVGMIIKVGEMQMIGTNERGTFPILAETVSELCRKASELTGGHRSGGRLVARSHNFVRKQFIPRAERYRKQTK